MNWSPFGFGCSGGVSAIRGTSVGASRRAFSAASRTTCRWSISSCRFEYCRLLAHWKKITSAGRTRPSAAYSSASSQYRPVSHGAQSSSCCTTATASGGSFAFSAAASLPGSYVPASLTNFTSKSGNTSSRSGGNFAAARWRWICNHRV